jgi:hypothetical protein
VEGPRLVQGPRLVSRADFEDQQPLAQTAAAGGFMSGLLRYLLAPNAPDGGN